MNTSKDGLKLKKTKKLSMVKRQVSFSKPGYQFLELQARVLGISVSEYVRRIVDEVRDKWIGKSV